MRGLPWCLILLRLIAGPTLLLACKKDFAGAWIVAIVVSAFISDVFDGIIARKWNVATPFLRRSDSAADSIFYLSAAFAAWLWHRNAILNHAILLAVLFTLELVRIVFDWIKFRMYASYHTYLSKSWGIVLAISVSVLLGFNIGGSWLSLAIIMGIVAEIEGFAISVILPFSDTDVRTIAYALRLRDLALRFGWISGSIFRTKTLHVPAQGSMSANHLRMKAADELSESRRDKLLGLR